MKWMRYLDQGQICYGIVEGARVQPTTQTWQGILAGKQNFDRFPARPIENLEILPPLPRPGKILAVGQNYADHCREQGKDPPSKPLLFIKLASAVIGCGDSIRWSAALTRQVDFEAELAVVIARPCRRVQPRDAMEYVLGYTAANDVSARDLQYADKQWTRGKGLDTFCPLGPTLVEAADIPDPQNLSVRCYLNDRLMQDGNTREMIFSVSSLISYCSQAFTLEPGDVLLTGTPHGVGVWRDPPVFLQEGDRVRVEIENVGRLENSCQIEQEDNRESGEE